MSPHVLIAGAGPSGLSLAITLRRFGIPLRIIDRAPQPSAVSKALAVWSGSLEALQGMQVIDEFVAAGKRLRALSVGDGGRTLAVLAVGDGIDSPYPYPLLLPQSRTEQILSARLSALGVEIERRVELMGLAQDGDGVTASLRHADNAIERGARALSRGLRRRAQLRAPALGIAVRRLYRAARPSCSATCASTAGPSTTRPSICAGTTAARWRCFLSGCRLARLRHARRDGGGDAPATMRGAPAPHGSAWSARSSSCAIRAGCPPSGSTSVWPRSIASGVVPGRRCRAYPQPRRRPGHEHRHPGRGQSRVEAGLRAERIRGCRTPARQLRGRAAAGRARGDRGGRQKQHLAFASSAVLRLVKNMAVTVFGNIPAVHRMLQVELSETDIVFPNAAWKLVGLAQDGDGVTASLRHADNAIEKVHVPYLVGLRRRSQPRASVARHRLRRIHRAGDIPARRRADRRRTARPQEHLSLVAQWRHGGTVSIRERALARVRHARRERQRRRSHGGGAATPDGPAWSAQSSPARSDLVVSLSYQRASGRAVSRAGVVFWSETPPTFTAPPVDRA